MGRIDLVAVNADQVRDENREPPGERDHILGLDAERPEAPSAFKRDCRRRQHVWYLPLQGLEGLEEDVNRQRPLLPKPVLQAIDPVRNMAWVRIGEDLPDLGQRDGTVLNRVLQ